MSAARAAKKQSPICDTEDHEIAKKTPKPKGKKNTVREIPFVPRDHLPVIRELLGVVPVPTPYGKGLFAGYAGEFSMTALYPILCEKPARRNADPTPLGYIMGCFKPTHIFMILEEAFRRLELYNEGSFREWAIVKYNILQYGPDHFKQRDNYSVFNEALMLKPEFGGNKRPTNPMKSEAGYGRWSVAVDVNTMFPDTPNRLGKEFMTKLKQVSSTLKEEIEPIIPEKMVQNALLESSLQTESMEVDQ